MKKKLKQIMKMNNIPEYYMENYSEKLNFIKMVDAKYLMNRDIF